MLQRKRAPSGRPGEVIKPAAFYPQQEAPPPHLQASQQPPPQQVLPQHSHPHEHVQALAQQSTEAAGAGEMADRMADRTNVNIWNSSGLHGPCKVHEKLNR